MILLSRRSKSEHSIVLLFGCGRVGAAIRDQLISYESFEFEFLPLGWRQTRNRAREIGQIHDRLIGIVAPEEGARSLRSSVKFVWAAGTAGMGASSQQTKLEFANFQMFLALMERAQNESGCQVEGHMISSAGGLFSGQTRITTKSNPSPDTHYGQLKLAQEQLLSQAQVASRHIYRLTSVYGMARGSARPGLIGRIPQPPLSRSSGQCFARG